MGSPDSRLMFKGVYYLESQNANMNPIAIRPEIAADFCAWEDTSNGRIIRSSKVLFDDKEVELQSFKPSKKIPATIEIISQDGESYKLVKLTKKIFNEKLKPIVARGGSLNFNDDEELQKFYLTQNFQC